jgi:hypothetical protein
MTTAAVLHSNQQDSSTAGQELGRAIHERFAGRAPMAVILFASPAYSYSALLHGLRTVCSPETIVGCSSAGTSTHEGISAASASSVVALALLSEDMCFQVCVQREIKADVSRAAMQLAAQLHPDENIRDGEDPQYPFHTVMLLMDVLAGYGEEFLHTFTAATAGRYQVFGGGAADDAAFQKTQVFAGEEALSDAAVALEISSKQPIGIGVSHGWTPASPPMRVTRSAGLVLQEIDGKPAVEAIESFATESGHVFDRGAPLPFFLHHVLGVVADEEYKLRVPLRVEEDGSLVCAAEVPVGSVVRVMRTRVESAADAAYFAANRARNGLQERSPGVAIFFDCAATRLRLGDTFEASVDEVTRALGTDHCIGCNTYGQFARVEGQFSGFHNCTAVVCAFPE